MKARILSSNWLWVLAFALLAAGLMSGVIPHAHAELLTPADRPSEVRAAELRTSVVAIINYFLGFLGLVAVAFVIYAGVLMVTSQGEDENTGKAKKILLYSGIGIVIILLSYAIVNLFVRAGDVVV